MFSKRFIKKLSIIIVIVLIVLWFGGNLGLYLYIKYTFGSKFGKALNYTPEKLRLTESNIEAETLHLMGLKLKFPFYEEDIRHIDPLFWFDHKLHQIMIKIEDKGKVLVIIFNTLPNNLENIEESLINKMWDRILFKKEDDRSHFGFIKASHYSRFKDYSWWNLSYNIKLSSFLVLKMLSFATFEKVYDFETPYLTGFLSEGKRNNSKRSMIDFSFAVKDIFYRITFISPYETSGEIKDIITTVQPVENIEKSYKEIEDKYKNKGKTRYPEELLLLSMISLKGITMDSLNKLLKIMEDKNYKPYIIDAIKKEIEYLKR